MPALAVAPKTGRSRVQPLAELRLTNGTGRIFARADEVDPVLWHETFGHRAKDFVYYQLLERTMSAGFIYRYLVLLLPNETPFALQPLILVDQDLAISLRGKLAWLVQRLRLHYPRLLRSRMLMAGCLVGEGHFGVANGFNRRLGVSMLVEALDLYAARERISLIALKDLPALERSEMQSLHAAGFFRLDGFPPLKLTLDFPSFDHYLARRLSKVTRKGLRRKFRRIAEARPPITLEVRKDCGEIVDQIYPLYLAVAERSPVVFEVFSREYFLELSLTMADRCRFFVWRQEKKVIAFSFCMIWGDTIYDQDLGLDYSVAHELSLYYLSFRDIVTWALRHGYRYYRTAPFNYDPKMHLRLEFEPVDLFVRHRSLWLNLLLSRLAPCFAPGKSDPVLRRHFRAIR